MVEISKNSINVEGGFLFCGGWNFSKSVSVDSTFIIIACTPIFHKSSLIENYNLLMIFQPFTKQLCGSGRQTFEGTLDCKEDSRILTIRPMVKANTPINANPYS